MFKSYDKVWIGLNNDDWLRRKKGKPFMKEGERKFIMENLKDVDWTYVMYPKIHNDDTACDFIDGKKTLYTRIWRMGKWSSWNLVMVEIENQWEFHQQKKMFVVLLVSIWFGD